MLVFIGGKNKKNKYEVCNNMEKLCIKKKNEKIPRNLDQNYWARLEFFLCENIAIYVL